LALQSLLYIGEKIATFVQFLFESVINL